MIIDARGRSCPEPVILTKKALEQNKNIATVIVDNDIAVENITRFAETRNLTVSVSEENGDFTLEIK
ncbi:MAG: sulfurtransferase TusA family protein [Oscillospiraceae bacterium]